jgi:hypothetical protein
MKKGLLAASILLFLASGVGFAYAYDRFSSAAELNQVVDRSMAKINAATDMAAAESESDMMKMDLEMLSRAKQNGMMGLGGGAVLLIASAVLFLKARKKNPSPS